MARTFGSSRSESPNFQRDFTSNVGSCSFLNDELLQCGVFECMVSGIITVHLSFKLPCSPVFDVQGSLVPPFFPENIV